MATKREYLEFVLERLEGVEGIAHRAMMGEYVLYCRGKVFGGIYDDRLLVKDVPAAARLMPGAPREAPYAGGKEMLLVEEVDDPEFLRRLVEAMAAELPEAGRKGRGAARRDGGTTGGGKTTKARKNG